MAGSAGGWDDETPVAAAGGWDEEPVEAAALVPEDKTGTGKVYDANRDVTESRVGYKLVGPAEKGNTTGAAAPAPGEPIGPAKKPLPPGFVASILHKYAQGGASDLHDEFVGSGATALRNTPGQYLALLDGTEAPAQTDLEQYRAGRAMERQETSAADKELGNWGIVPQAAGAVTQAIAGAPLIKAAGKALTPALAGMGKVRAAANVAGANALAPGALQAFGASKADVTQGEIPQALAETALGTTMNAGTAGLVGGAGALAEKGMDATGFTDWIKAQAQKAADGARSMRDERFFKILGTGKGDFQKMDYLDNEGDIAQFAFDNDMVGRLTTAEDLVKRSAAARAAGGAKVGGALDQADAKASPDQLPNVGETLTKLRALRADYERKPGFAKIIPKLDAEIEAIEKSIVARAAGGSQPADPRVSFRDHEGDFKAPYDESIDWEADKVGQKAAKDARSGFKAVTEDKLQALDPELAAQFSAGKKEVGNAASIEALGRKEVSADKARRRMSPSDNAYGIAAGMSEYSRSHNPLYALAAGALAGGTNHVARNYGPAAGAVTANNVLNDATQVATNGLPVAATVDKIVNPAVRQETQDRVNQFIEWLRSQGSGE